MYMLNMVIILIVMYCNVVTAIDKIPTYLLRFNNVLVDERTIGLSRLSPRGPVEVVIFPAEGCPSMGEEREVTEGVGVRALVNVGLVVSTACIASTKEA